MDFRERLSTAGNAFDGHVTNGSLEAQVQVVRDYLEDFYQTLRSELKVAGDFGRFDDPKGYGGGAPPYPEYVAIAVAKKVKETYERI